MIKVGEHAGFLYKGVIYAGEVYKIIIQPSNSDSRDCVIYYMRTEECNYEIVYNKETDKVLDLKKV